jgi:lysozyme family protein
MTVEFEEAVHFVLANEGGYTELANDTGGATNFGISLRLLRSLHPDTLRRCGVFVDPATLTPADMHELSLEQAQAVYKLVFWEAAPFGDIDNAFICKYVFDCAVLHGVAQAIRFLQRACWAVASIPDYVTDDGILGAQTVHLVNIFGNDVKHQFVLLAALMAERAGYCRLIAATCPEKKEFLDGWLNRCYRL